MALRQRLADRGQGHVFRFWDELSPEQRDHLARQCAGLDLERLEAALAVRSDSTADQELEPLEVLRLPEYGGEASLRESAASRGEELLRRGAVGVLVVAGGQATRLGFDGPKGLFPLGPVSGRTLFEIQAQKLRRLRERTGAALPWYVMTSPATDAATRAYFEANAHLGLPAEDVFFFSQGTVPSFDFDGRLLLGEKGRLADNPDGHGGVVAALLASGALDDMERRGVTTLFYHQVDNPLVRMADPVFVGLHAERGAEVSCKAVRKTDPDEKVGVLARRGGRPGVVEYTELDPGLREARGADGELRFWAGNIAIHVFDVAFLRRIASAVDRWLPYHVARKKIPHVDADGARVVPDEPNGFKLERFVFDVLPAAESICALEVAREREFAPVKNASGDDSPDTARRDLIAEYTRWLELAGSDVPEGCAIEIDHARIDSAEDARRAPALAGRNPGDVVRIETGARA